MDQLAISGLGVQLHWAVFTAADSQTAEVLESQIAPKINVRLGLCRRRGERGGEASYSEKAVFVVESAGGAGRMETEVRSRRRKERIYKVKEEGSAETLEAE